MKFSVSLEKFVDFIFPVLNISNKNNITDSRFAGFVTVFANDKYLLLRSNGGQTSCAVRAKKDSNDLDYSCEEEGEVTVKSVFLQDALDSMPEGNVTFELVDGSLNISKSSGKKNKRMLQTYSFSVPLDKIASDFKSVLVVNKSILKDMLGQVSFAASKEEKSCNYQCVAFQANQSSSKHSLVAMAGNVSRFVSDKIVGDKIFGNDFDSEFILIPSKNIENLCNILDKTACDFVEIRAGNSKTNDIQKQVVFLFNDIVVCMVGMDRLVKSFPDFSKIIDYDYPNVITTNLDSWSYASKGISLSVKISRDGKMEDQVPIHNSEISFADGEMNVVTKTVPINETSIDIVSVDKQEDIEKIWVRCNSEYLREMYKMRNKKALSATFSFESMEALKNGDKDKIKPILVQFDDWTDDARGTVETVHLFFATSSR